MEAPPPDDSLEEEEEEEGRANHSTASRESVSNQSHDCVLPGRQPSVTVSELRDRFLSGRRGAARGSVQHQLIVRIINKSHLMYYGRTDRNCECPYKVSGSALVYVSEHGGGGVMLWARPLCRPASARHLLVKVPSYRCYGFSLHALPTNAKVEEKVKKWILHS